MASLLAPSTHGTSASAPIDLDLDEEDDSLAPEAAVAAAAGTAASLPPSRISAAASDLGVPANSDGADGEADDDGLLDFDREQRNSSSSTRANRERGRPVDQLPAAACPSRLASVCWSMAVIVMSIAFIVIGIAQVASIVRGTGSQSAGSSGVVTASTSAELSAAVAAAAAAVAAAAVSTQPSPFPSPCASPSEAPSTAVQPAVASAHAPERMIVVAGWSGGSPPFDLTWLLYYFSDSE